MTDYVGAGTAKTQPLFGVTQAEDNVKLVAMIGGRNSSVITDIKQAEIVSRWGA